jgi:hypothetical protein
MHVGTQCSRKFEIYMAEITELGQAYFSQDTFFQQDKQKGQRAEHGHKGS